MKKQEIFLSRKTSTVVALSALLLSIAAFGTLNAFGQQNPNVNYAPGIPDTALQYNRTDTTPSGQMEQVRAMETYMFNYRNLTLVLNCTRNCEFNITVDPALKPKVLSLSIEPNQNMSLTMNMTSTPSEAEMIRTQTLNFYLGLEPNATLELQAQIRLHINQTELSQELNREINASRLTWMYWNTTEQGWVQVPSWADQNNYLVCNTTHFSTWTVTEISPESTPSPTTTPNESPSQSASPSVSESPLPSETPIESAQNKGFPVEYIYFGAAIAVVAVLVIGVLVYKKRKP
jgi:hypothetical protein